MYSNRLEIITQQRERVIDEYLFRVHSTDSFLA